MPAGTSKIAFVVATKDRPTDIRNLLGSLAHQSQLPDQVVIVDASARPVEDVAGEFPSLGIRYIRHLPPSASAQRNAGIKAVDPDVDLIGFLDDDAVLDPGAMEAMMQFWHGASADVGGCGFNWMNPSPRGKLGTWLKSTSLVGWFGLYSREQGKVMPSGWQTLAVAVPETMFVEWLSSCASIWRRQVFEEFGFDEWFDGYSYLEDLDFSYSVGKRYRLAIVANAGFRHYPSRAGRGSAYRFGMVEVRNRLYFVRKQGLSIPRCYGATLIRLLITVGSIVLGGSQAKLARAAGNLAALVRSRSFVRETTFSG